MSYCAVIVLSECENTIVSFCDVCTDATEISIEVEAGEKEVYFT